MQKRNRAQRRASVVYRLDTLYRPLPSDDPITEAILQAGPPSIVDPGDLEKGEIDDVVFLSVPVTTSAHSCERLKEIVSVALGDKRLVTILTHNIELLRARKLDTKQATAVLRNVQEHGTVPEVTDEAALARTELAKAVYERVHNVLDAQETLEPAAAAEVLESLRQLITKVEAEYADQDTGTAAEDSDGEPSDNRH